MRLVNRSKRFIKDIKRESKGQYKHVLTTELIKVIEMLAKDEEINKKYQDHQLAGNLKEYRELHLKPDLLLLYKKEDKLLRILRLERLASHAELFK